MQMSWKSYTTTFYSILAAAAQITHSRANSRLNSLFLTFMGGAPSFTLKTCNRFHIPPSQALKLRAQIGESRYPDTLDVDCLPEFFHRLLAATGAANSMAHAPCLTSASYKADGFIACLDFEKVPGQSQHSGVNTFSSQLSVFLEGLQTDGGALALDSCYLTSFHDVMLEITANGCVVAV